MISCKEITDLLADYLEGSLDQQTVQALEAHFSGCRTCDNFLETYRTTTTFVRDLGGEEVPAELKERIIRFVREHRGRQEEEPGVEETGGDCKY